MPFSRDKNTIYNQMNIRLLQGNSQRMRTRHMWFWMRNIQLFWFFKIPNSCGTEIIWQFLSMLPLVCSVIGYRWRQNAVRTSKWHKRRSWVCYWFSYHILTSSVIYCRTDQPQRGIYLFFMTKKQKVLKWWRHIRVCPLVNHW